MVELDHVRLKKALHLIIVSIEEQNNEDPLEIVKEQLKTKSQIQTTYLTQETHIGKILEHKHKLICVKVSCNDHKLDIFRKCPSLKGTRIFINEDIIPEDLDELRKEVQRSRWQENKGNELSLGIRKLLLEIESKIRVINRD